ncbi:PspA/IM30 family protein [Actinomyces bowdenii]|uniref:PspA/IM30 family protein n=1 Tax=Actinomyces bowdenii TaxID=131109 RepID=A0A3P1V767_9ACTO|nr:PspA/IM30 family protein [Actinomyces bowdenii]MBO3725571.1 PspA/IM30 family protein [Actinomyces bowdenii]RRD29185.1 PspA/IM30 family protein [Actinomyces bowdenii]
MAEKQSILGRIAQLTRANINALLDRAEDPEKMLNQLVRDYTASIAEARDAVAQTIGNLRLAEKDHDEDVATARDWGNKALAASRKADQMRAAGDGAGADKWDSLAKIALTKQITAENEAKAAEPMIASQRQVVDQLKTGLQQMEVKLGELQSRRDQLIARQKTAEAQVKVQGAIRSINVMDPTSELARYEDQVRRVEAQAAGQMELAGSSLESQFAELESSSAQLEAEARLAALKAGSDPALQPAPPAPAQITDGDVNAAFDALKAQDRASGQAQPQGWPQEDDHSSY